MIGNLDGFLSERSLHTNQLKSIDQYVIGNLSTLISEAREYYETFEYHKLYKMINEYVNEELSAFYFESVKDRLYSESRNSILCQSAQTAIYHIAEALMRLVAPIVPLLAEEVNRQIHGSESVFHVKFPEFKHQTNHDLVRDFEYIKRIRSDFLQLFDAAKKSGKFKSTTQVHLTLSQGDPHIRLILYKYGTDCYYCLFNISKVMI